MELKDGQKLYLIVGVECVYDLQVIKTFTNEDKAKDFLKEIEATEDYDEVRALTINYYEFSHYLVLITRYRYNGWENLSDLSNLDYHIYPSYLEAEAFTNGIDYVDNQYITKIENIPELEIED